MSGTVSPTLTNAAGGYTPKVLPDQDSNLEQSG
jgi:hypothetical protein